MNHGRVTVLTFLVTVYSLSQSRGCHGLDAILEHSIDGETFHKAATVHATPTKQSNVLPLESPQDYTAAVESLVGSTRSGGYYYMRFKYSEERSVLSSIPLECWINAGSQARIELHLHGRKTDEVASIALVAPCPPSLSSSTTDKVSIESCTIVKPRVVVAPALPQQTDRVLEPIDEQQQGSDTTMEGRRNTTKSTQDDRTWLQKNWLFVGLAFFIIANKLGSAAEAAQRQQGQGS